MNINVFVNFLLIPRVYETFAGKVSKIQVKGISKEGEMTYHGSKLNE